MGIFELLSDELLFKIFNDKCILAEDLVSLKNVCCRFDQFCDNEKLWKPRFQSRFPLVWRKISSSLEDGMKELQTAVTIGNQFAEIFNSLCHKLYKFKNVPLPILSSIFELLNIGNFGHIIIFGELSSILNQERETDLTKIYYAKLVHYHIRHYLCSKELKEFFKLPPGRKNLEKGAYLFSKVFQPKAFDNEYTELSLKLDEIAMQVQIYLRSLNSNHPAASIKFFSPDEPLECTKWSHEECLEIFECINCALYRKGFLSRNGFYLQGMYRLENSLEDLIKEECFNELQHTFINKVVETKNGNDITLSILYNAICHRLGVILHPTIRSNRYMLRWKSPNSENIQYINPCCHGQFEDLGVSARNGVCIADCSAETMLAHLAADSFHTAEEFVTDFVSDPDMTAAAGMILLFESISEDENEKFFDDVFAYCLKYEVHLEAVIELCAKLSRRNTVAQYKIRSISRSANDMIKLQSKPRLIKPKERKFIKVKYAVGMMIKLEGIFEAGVIFGWDKDYDKVNESTFKKNPCLRKHFSFLPYYKIFASDGWRYYLSEKDISLAKRLAPIDHCEVGKYFRLFNGIFYVPNEELRLEYPDDEKVKHQFLKDYVSLISSV